MVIKVDIVLLMMKPFKYIIFVLGLLFVGKIFAQVSDGSAGAVAAQMTQPLDVARQAFNAGSLVLGIGFVISGVFKYLRYRHNPHEAPISSVVILFLVGLAFLAFPFAYDFSQYLANK